MKLDDATVQKLRAQFPALARQQDGRPVVYFDGPAGTQVPNSVVEAITHVLQHSNANSHGVFATSRECDALTDEASLAAADLLGTDDPQTIAWGANMTTMTLALSRALSRTWQPGDEIVLSRLEHDANFTPWRLAAEDRDVVVHYVDVDPSDCSLRLDIYRDLLGPRTRLVAVGCASNAVGTINPVQQICQWAHEVGALTFLDAVHYAPHATMDVQAWDCDFLACSAYKFFGPHVGIMYGKRELLESLEPYKLRPAPDSLPGRWMTGTPNFSSLHGARAAIDYLASLGGDASQERNPSPVTRRERLGVAMDLIGGYEQQLVQQLLVGLEAIPTIRVWGPAADSPQPRCPTVSITHAQLSATELAQRLADAGIFTWDGNFYALPLTEHLGLEPDGMVRIGLTHYNTAEEVQRLLHHLSSL